MKILKKAQMEAFGLVFIVLLLALGIFFMTYTSMKKQKESQTLSPSTIDLGQNMIDAIKEIKLECFKDGSIKNIPLSDFIQDIALEEDKIYCNGVNSATYFEYAMKNILNATLVQRNTPFYFSLHKRIKNQKQLPYIYFNNENIPNCGMIDDNLDKDPPGDGGFQGYPYGGNTEIEIYICEMKYVDKNITT